MKTMTIATSEALLIHGEDEKNDPAILNQIIQLINHLTPESQKSVLDFVLFLTNKESEEATQELLNIPGFMESFEEGKQDIANGNFTNWRSIRHDV